MLKAYKYKLEPTTEQKVLIEKLTGELDTKEQVIIIRDERKRE